MLGKIDRPTISDGRKKKRLFKKGKRKDLKTLIIAIVVIAAIITVFVLGVTTSLKIKTSSYIIEYGNLPKNFDGYKIVQITDYHKGVYANDNKSLADEIKVLNPDIIVMTGDLIDSGAEDINNASELGELLVDIADVIWIKGNHFYKTDQVLAKKLQEKMDSLGVISLVNDSYVITEDNESIEFCGLDDPERLYSAKMLPGEYSKVASQKAMERFLSETVESSDDSVWFKILLSHRYSIYDSFPEKGFSLAMAGHSHGGQFKLPWGVDLIGYDLSLFPKVKSGYNNIDGMPLIVSSGLGTSNINLRLYNPPEIVCVELKSK